MMPFPFPPNVFLPAGKGEDRIAVSGDLEEGDALEVKTVTVKTQQRGGPPI
jgi:hypothetical protein